MQRPKRAGRPAQAARWLALAVAALIAASAWPAVAQIDLLSRDTIHGVVDLRAAASGGEPSFTHGGFGKSRYGGAGARAQVAEAALEWTPQFDWDWNAVVDVGYQPGQEHRVDILQAYLVFRPTPRSATRFAARIGYFYPPISLEHDARAWGVTDTITPSAIDTWVGEELKVVGAEATVSRQFGDQSLAVTVALFGYDDTAGTLLSFRGWALDDIKSQARGSFRLPPLAAPDASFQASETYSTLEIDHRLGYYVKLEWRPDAPVTLDALAYDNRGDGTRVTSDGQWAWNTRFVDVGATAQLGAFAQLKAQAMSGRTWIGAPGPRLVDVSFRSAYLLATRDLGKNSLTLRADAFETRDNAPGASVAKGERGWALDGAWRRPLNRCLDVRIEALRIDSVRPGRILAGESPHQVQTVLQSSLRLTF